MAYPVMLYLHLETDPILSPCTEHGRQMKGGMYLFQALHISRESAGPMAVLPC